MPTTEQARERFEALFREHHGAVRGFARRRVPAESVDDIVSETFLVAWRRLDSMPLEATRPWLLGVARNVVGTERRGQARRLGLWVRAQDAFVAGQDPVDPEAAGDGRVLGALSHLSERDREALTLVAWDGLTPSQAAAALDEPSNRFRVRLQRAGRRLRWELTCDPQEKSAASDTSTDPHTGLKGAAVL